MNAQDLFNLAPFGARVDYTDGTAKPPARFKNKLSTWESRNSWGYFVRAHKDIASTYDQQHFTLMRDLGFIVINGMFLPTDTRQFEVTPPPAGAILAYSTFKDEVEIKKVWDSLDEARLWAQTKGYNLANCGYRYFIVGDDGSLAEFVPTPAEAIA